MKVGGLPYAFAREDSMGQRYDLIAIGGGSGGLSVAERAAAHGARCAVVEDHRLGGTCVNQGCVPKKVMWYAATLAHSLEDARDYGFVLERGGFDWALLKQRRDAYVHGINDWYQRYLADSEIDHLAGTARFIDAHTLEVAGQRYQAEHIVVATGGVPVVPEVTGAELGITSDGFFELERQPRRVAIVGAGYIAVELAGLLRALGSEVSLILRRQQVLARFDAMLREALTEEMLADGINILSCIQLRELRRSDDGRIDLLGDEQQLRGFDAVIWAVGRAPRTAELDLAAAGLTTDEQGFIPVDDYQNTAVAGVYAVGDVTGRAALTPVAIAAGRRLADRLFGGQPERKLDYELIPSVVFSHPPVATVGLTEGEARARHGDSVKVYQSRFTPMVHAFTRRQVKTALKLITVGARERIVGCHIIGHAADEMLQGFAVAIRMGASKRDFDDTIAIHPTSAEELVTLR